MNGENAKFSLTLLVKVEGCQLIRIDALVFLVIVRKRKERTHACTPSPASSGGALGDGHSGHRRRLTTSQTRLECYLSRLLCHQDYYISISGVRRPTVVLYDPTQGEGEPSSSATCAMMPRVIVFYAMKSSPNKSMYCHP